jgi:prolyl-tRNA editing enzyme YbaK/EbsC (Cys-tRNA(Pro) deacylase)
VASDDTHPRAAAFVDRAREAHGLDLTVEEFPEGTKTAADAAAAIGCSIGQIASSIVFLADDDPLVVVTSGANRVDEDRLAEYLDVKSVETAAPDTVRSATGYAIGGVPPFCHHTDISVYLDETILGFETVWAAAGTPEAVFPIPPERLQAAANADPVAVATSR